MKPETNKQIFTCYIKTLSPVHIGCDEVYEPTGFVMNEQARQMVVFNPVDFISTLSEDDRARFNDICSKGTVSSILEIYKFLRNRTATGRKVNVCNGFVDHYKKTLDMNVSNEKRIQQELNSFSIPRTSFSSSDQRPYIPGSSVKGSLRTAYLNLLEKKKHLSSSQRFNKGQDLEKALMNYRGTDDDPFRLVKVSDFMPVGDAKTKIIYGVNVKKKVSDKEPQGGAFFFEIIHPGAIFEGTIRVETPLKGAGIRIPVELETLLNGASEFYLSEKKREDRELSIIGIPSSFLCDENAVLVRCGRHSGAESVTVNGHRSIKIMGKKGEKQNYLPRATTFWLTSDVKKPAITKELQPFGWAELHKITDDSKKTLSVKEQEYQNALALERKKKIHEAQRQQQLRIELAEAKEKKAREAEEKQLAEEQRQAELDAMSPEERMLAEFENPAILENRVVEIFNKIDEFPEDIKNLAAEAMKKYWKTNNKWVVKKKKQKQWVKIQKIKAILGEE